MKGGTYSSPVSTDDRHEEIDSRWVFVRFPRENCVAGFAEFSGDDLNGSQYRRMGKHLSRS